MIFVPIAPKVQRCGDSSRKTSSVFFKKISTFTRQFFLFLNISLVKNSLSVPLLFAVFFTFFYFPGSAFSKVNANDLLNEGKKLFDQRAEGCVGLMAKPEKINAALVVLEQAYALGANQEETGAYLMKCYNYKGRFACPKASDKKGVFEKGKNLGETLLKKYPNSASLLYEYICVLGLWGNEIGSLKAGWDGVIGKLRTSTEKLIEVDRTYSGCAGERIMGLMYMRAPYIPLVLTWPDNEEALGYLEKAVKCSPNDFGSVFYYAEALHKNKQEVKALEYMKKVLVMTPRKELYLEDLQFIKDAEVMLKEWN